MACCVLGRLGSHKLMKNTIRELGGLSQILRRLKAARSDSHDLRESIVRAISILVLDSEVNQNFVR